MMRSWHAANLTIFRVSNSYVHLHGLTTLAAVIRVRIQLNLPSIKTWIGPTIAICLSRVTSQFIMTDVEFVILLSLDAAWEVSITALLPVSN